MSLRPKLVNYEETWPDFLAKLQNMFQQGSLSKESGLRMYEQVHAMCTARPKPHTETLFNDLALYLAHCSTEACKRILEHDDVVSAYVSEWKRYKLATTATNMTCDYLNRLIVKDSLQTIGDLKLKRQTVESLAFLLWKDRVIANIKFEHGDKLMFQILELFEKDRREDLIPGQALATAVLSLVELNRYNTQRLQMYIELFEKPYLVQTMSHYTRESNQAAETLSVSQFMHEAMRILEQEVDRNRKYCDKSTFDKAIQTVEAAFIERHQKRIHDEFEAMVRQYRTRDCTLAFQLLSRISNGVDPLLDTFASIITEEGKDAIVQMGANVAKDPKAYVTRLIGLHSKYMGMADTVFSSSLFVATVDKAFRVLTNDTTSNPAAHGPELLAKYSDIVLRKNVKGQALSESDVDDALSKIITLFKYIDDKDIFQRYYSRMLARRLIQGISTSDDAEEMMVARLKAACGVEYTSKLQRMFTDMTVSSELGSAFRGFLDRLSWKGIDIGVLVLTAGSWPLTGQTTQFQLPPQLESGVIAFSNFYTGKFSGRKLQWLHHLAKADVKLGYTDKRYEITMSLYQLAVLLQFSDKDQIDEKELAEATQLPDLKRVVSSLVDAKLLVSAGDTWQLNKQFERCVSLHVYQHI